jgi:putative oxidoreductase
MPNLSALQHAGRIGLAAFFMLAGLNKVLSPADTQAIIASAGLVPVLPIYLGTIAFELGAGLTLALGRRWAAFSAILLALFCLATNLLFHRFWQIDGPMAQAELSMFFKNVAIAAALIYVAATERVRHRQTPHAQHC